MELSKKVEYIEEAWQAPDGVLFKLRTGIFDRVEFEELLDTLRGIESAEPDGTFPQRFIALLWYLPLFMEWQRERVHEAGGDVEALERAITVTINELERILGIP